MIKNNYVCDVNVKHITTFTNQHTTRSQRAGQLKKGPKSAYFHKGPAQRYKKRQARKLR